MMIKVNDEYLDFNDNIIIEKQAKLFEDISNVNGDFSYSFDLSKTSNNLRILSTPFADVKNKSIYQKVNATISNDGITLYTGFLRVERITNVIKCSFYSGNNNWFAEIAGNLNDIDFSAYDEVLSKANILSGFTRTSNLKYLVADPGQLQLRGAYLYGLFDFVPVFFVKDILKKCFTSSGLKVDGELFNDTLFNKATISLNDNNEELERRKEFASKTSAQVMPGPGPFDPTGILTFDNDTTDPYYHAEAGNFDLTTGRFTADVPMFIQLEVTTSDNSVKYDGLGEFVGINILVNDTTTVVFAGNTAILVDNNPGTVTTTTFLNAGDFISLSGFRSPASPSDQDVNNITYKITPLFLFKTFVNSSLPKWTKQKFVSNMLNAFNIIPYFDKNTATVTLNLFDKIKDKTPIDLSEFIVDDSQVDYTDFISNYAQKNIFKYNTSDVQEVSDFNDLNNLPYNSGVIDVDNFYIEKEATVLELDLSSPYNYNNKIFKSNFEKVNINDYTEDNQVDSVAVNDASGQASIEVGNNYAGFVVGDLIRVSESTYPGYNGDWFIESLLDGNSILPYGMAYYSNAHLKVTKLTPKRSVSDNTYLLADTGAISMTDYSLQTNLALIDADGTITITPENPSIGFFNWPNVSLPISTSFKQSLSFDKNSYQLSLLDQYFKIFEGILNDPVKYTSTAYLPLYIYMQIDFLKPVTIKSLTTTNLYYINKITGYVDSKTPCTIELIKLP